MAITTLINIGCGNKTASKEEIASYSGIKPLVIDTAYDKEYIAQIQSVQNIEVRAQEKGYLQKIYIDEGQYVKAGQMLFTIMPRLYEADVLKAKAGIAKAQAGVLKAKAEIKASETELLNAKTLADKDIVSKSEKVLAQAKLEGAKSEYEAQNAELSQAKAELLLAETHLSLTGIKAPFDGVVDRIPHKLGSLIDEGEMLTTLSDNRSIYAYFNMPESEYLNFKLHHNNSDKANNLQLLLANGEMYNQFGIVQNIEGEFDNETGNIAFRAKFPNPDLLLKHGETGKIQMRVSLNNAMIIPQKATYELQDKVYVYVVDKNNVIKSKEIKIKSRLPELFVIESGLAPDDKILIEGLQKVKDGDKISYKEEDAKTVISNLQLIK